MIRIRVFWFRFFGAILEKESDPDPFFEKNSDPVGISSFKIILESKLSPGSGVFPKGQIHPVPQPCKKGKKFKILSVLNEIVP